MKNVLTWCGPYQIISSHQTWIIFFYFSKQRVLVEASKYIEYVPYLYFFLEKPMLHQNPSIYIKLIELLLLLSVLMLS